MCNLKQTYIQLLLMQDSTQRGGHRLRFCVQGVSSGAFQSLGLTVWSFVASKPVALLAGREERNTELKALSLQLISRRPP